MLDSRMLSIYIEKKRLNIKFCFFTGQRCPRCLLHVIRDAQNEPLNRTEMQAELNELKNQFYPN